MSTGPDLLTVEHRLNTGVQLLDRRLQRRNSRVKMPAVRANKMGGNREDLSLNGSPWLRQNGGAPWGHVILAAPPFSHDSLYALFPVSSTQQQRVCKDQFASNTEKFYRHPRDWHFFSSTNSEPRANCVMN
jgi:hypothetical protein